MGNDQSSQAHPQSHLCRELQDVLLSEKEKEETNQRVIPRSTKVDGRFVLSKEHFPDYIDYGSLSDIFKWRTEAEPLESYTKEFLDTNLPVLTPDKTILTRGL
jgi:hypothetical protein